MACKNIDLIAAIFQDKYIIRFVVCSRVTESRDITFAWKEIRSQANEYSATMPTRKKRLLLTRNKMALPKKHP
jgi:hypothetical protein